MASDPEDRNSIDKAIHAFGCIIYLGLIVVVLLAIAGQFSLLNWAAATINHLK